MKYRFYLCDVFTDTRFGGNPLAVLPHADGLSAAQMQQIAREFNFSETTFVFPARSGHTREVRIFTPANEVPFAGHPNVGTAFVLASTGELGEIHSSLTVAFEEKAGIVSVAIEESAGTIASCELLAPQPLSLGAVVPAPLVASALSLASDDIAKVAHAPRVASVGLPFVIAELADRSALERARADVRGFEALLGAGVPSAVHMYVRSSDGYDIRARMFAPLHGVNEDPATGSASCALAGLLADANEQASGLFRWRIAQGVEMGRPSTLVARAEKKDGVVRATWVGGACVLVGEGTIHVD